MSTRETSNPSEYPHVRICPSCSGHGTVYVSIIGPADEHGWFICGTCNGAGRIRPAESY